MAEPSLAEVRHLAGENDWIALAVRAGEQLLEARAGTGAPTPHLVYELQKLWPGAALRFLHRRAYSDGEIQDVGRDLAGTAALFGRAQQEISPVARRNVKRHGDPGPFLVARRARFRFPARWGAKKARCFKCSEGLWVPNRRTARWYESGAATICPVCAGSWPGRLLGTL